MAGVDVQEGVLDEGGHLAGQVLGRIGGGKYVAQSLGLWVALEGDEQSRQMAWACVSRS